MCPGAKQTKEGATQGQVHCYYFGSVDARLYTDMIGMEGLRGGSYDAAVAGSAYKKRNRCDGMAFKEERSRRRHVSEASGG